ncbi:MAG: hypothetical protein IKB76_01945 [Kiritimatiellae bacterium]|nr:hypothetical protein [Kiritimatiellia bacterium]
MNAQDIIRSSQLTHIRELQTALTKAAAENSALHNELDSLKAHFDMALLAAMDLKGGEPLEIWDGWNLILGAKKEAKDRADLIAQAKASGKRVWIVLDGHDENVKLDGKVRISYTGGQGEHRADKFIIDFVRMAAYLGLADGLSVRTNDKDFRKAVERLKSDCNVQK